MKKLCCSVLLLIVFLLPRAAVAQTLTTVTATISDPQNFKYTGARVTVSLVGTTGTVSTTPCPGNNLAAGCVVQLPSPFFTDSLTGKFTINLWANASIACAPVACPSTSYTFTIQSYGATANPPIGTGPQSFTVSGVVISGASQDISATISAGAPSLTNVGSAVSGVSSVFTRTGAVTAQLGDYNLSLINPGTAPAGTYNFGGSTLLGSAIQDSGGFATILLGQHFATQYTVDTVMGAFLAVVPDAACASQDCVKLAPASSTSGIIGILNSTIGTAPSTGSIVQIGPSSWQIDNACSYGEAVIASSTAGEGHCTTTPGTNQVVAYTMISGVSAGTYYVNVIAGQGVAGSTGGSSQPTDQQTVVNYTIPSTDFASGTSGAGTILQRSNAAAMGDTLTDPTGAGSYIIISNCTGTTLQNGGAQCVAGTSALTVTRQTSALFYGPSTNVGSYGATTLTVNAGQKCFVHSLSATAWSVDGCSTIGVGAGGSGGFAGTVTYTTSTTASTSDNQKLVLMNCASACSYTLPNPQPSTTWSAWVMNAPVAAATATVALGATMTFQGGATVPVIPGQTILHVAANTATSTDYTGGTQPTITASSNTLFLPNGTAIRWAGTGSSASFDNHCGACQMSFNINGSGFFVIGDGSTNNPGFGATGGGIGSQQALWNIFKATAALTAGQTVKIDTANNDSVVVGTTTDTGGGVIIGIVENSPGVGGNAFVVLSGEVTSPLLGTGTCAIGNFVIQDTTTNGRVKCTATFTAGTVIGKALKPQTTVGSAVDMLVQPE